MNSDQELFVVGIGSSAGGVEALEELFRAMPSATGLCFVLVAHLARDRKSLLAEIVGRYTEMPVQEASDGMRVAPDHVYITPPAGMLKLQDSRLRVEEDRGPRPHLMNPIDFFFLSLAANRGEHAIGILLSGGGSDGTVGFRAIKESGGLTMAQGSDHTGPRHASMPTSAISAGVVDIVAPAEAMPEKLLAYVQSFRTTLDEVAGRRGRPPAKEGNGAAARREICAILRDQVGHDFAGYKERTFLRRVQRRMQILQLASLQAYVARLRDDPDEVTLLFHDLLIGVTTFFRDGEAFDQLATAVVPKLFEGKGAGGTIRVWVPGCATGEEVYSIAILLREQLDGHRNPPKIQIFGTDIDERALVIARAGRYSVGALGEVTPERLRRFFAEDAGWCVLAKEVRDMCIFSAHSIVRDPPFSRIDLISCRNLLIYLDADLQMQVMPMFHYALRPGGYLFLGSSENVSQHADLFAPIDKKHRLFQRRDHAPPQVQFPLMMAAPRVASPANVRRLDKATVATSLRRAVDARVLERFAPAHVVVNRDGDVLYYSLRTGKYLEQPAGTPSRQLIAMARKGLPLDLRAALQEAVETRRTVTREWVTVETDDRVQPINLTVEPLGDHGTETLFLVLFTDLGPALTPEQAARHLPLAAADGDGARLELELRDTRERLQSTIEEYETALEELKAANEELVSMNEELQSTNEELETSKEEIQSINEELQTVNSELGKKVEQLNLTNADLTNLLDSTQIAVVFLDRQLIIRSFTQAVTGIISLIPSDRGRPLTDIATSLDYAGLESDVRQVMASGQELERQITRRDAPVHYLMRVLPYRTFEGGVGGALITFVDVTSSAQAEQQQRLLVHELNHRVRNMLAVVSAIASQTLARTKEPKTFAASFLGRVQALARSHALLARDQWGDVGLAELLGGELAPYADGEARERVTLDGPALMVKPKAALALGLVAHELATNALKHGALAGRSGRVAITWQVEAGDGGQRLALRWQEMGATATPDGAEAGFGTLLVDREVQHELGGTVARSFGPNGLEVVIALPLQPLLALVGGAEGSGRGP